MRDLLLLAITGACSVFAIGFPTFGLLTYVAYGVLSPQSYTWDFSRYFPHSKFIAVATIFGSLFSSEARNFPRQRESLLLFLLWVLFGISTILAFDAGPAWGYFFIVTKVFLMAFVCMSLINTEQKLQLLLKVIAVGLGLYAVKIGIFVLRTGGHSAVSGAEGTYFESNNTIGMALAMNVPLLFYLSKIETRAWLCWSMRLMLLLSYPAVIGTFARADWLGLIVVTALMMFKSKRKMVILVIAGIFLMTVGVASIPQFFSKELGHRYDTLVNY
jgi:putative inorganic carbon (HCO3(-)) transporter